MQRKPSHSINLHFYVCIFDWLWLALIGFDWLWRILTHVLHISCSNMRMSSKEHTQSCTSRHLQAPRWRKSRSRSIIPVNITRNMKWKQSALIVRWSCATIHLASTWGFVNTVSIKMKLIKIIPLLLKNFLELNYLNKFVYLRKSRFEAFVILP